MSKKGGNVLSCGIYNRTRHYYNEIVMCISTMVTYIKCTLQAIAIGRNCKFHGVPVFIQGRGGFISIGDKCEFRSRTFSNFIGLNHGCILTATPAYRGTTAKLTIGNNCGMSGVSVWCFSQVYIGNNVRIGANALIMDGDAHFDDSRTTPPQKLEIQDDVFIGANCVIKKGVTIGQGSIIGMNSVVTKDIPPYSIAAGVPARVIRKILSEV